MYQDLFVSVLHVGYGWLAVSFLIIGLAILSIALLDEFIALIRGIKPSYHGKGENLLATDDDTELIDAAASEDSRA